MKHLPLLSLFALLFSASLSAQTPKQESASTTFKVCDVVKTTATLEEKDFLTIIEDDFVNSTKDRNAAQFQSKQWDAYQQKRMEVEAAHKNSSKKKMQAALKAIPLPTDDYSGPVPQIESYSRDRRAMIPAGFNAFYTAAERAYAGHRPLSISPDDVWLLICQGFANHVTQNAEQLRNHFVSFDGKKTLNIELNQWPEQDSGEWEAMFTEFNRQIAMYSGEELNKTINTPFSTSTQESKAAFSLSMMTAMQEYFDYWGTILCGIPEITLQGKPEDWEAIETRAEQLSQYDLDWWISELKPVLHEFTAASKGQANVDFWQKMIKMESKGLGCGSTPALTGWISKFYPYIQSASGGGKMVRNPLIGINDFSKYYVEKKDRDGHAFTAYDGPMIEPKELPSSTVSVPVCINDNGVLHKLMVYSGFLGVHQDRNSLALSPAIGWVIVETNEKPDAESVKRYEEFIKQRQTPTAKKD